ncbi:hypothetical protein MKK69_20260 [Methylobacterium sp. J-026]|nr:hypothetical protein [Methylobacterium sp. J-026]
MVENERIVADEHVAVPKREWIRVDFPRREIAAAMTGLDETPEVLRLHIEVALIG